ncbi:MAG: NAD-dependent deacylase [Bacteroidales bacterium]|nr:NAD-dependent deacylase [Bacteroidales bacterium]MBN2699186.1 NAD-dependent deacylase [Bacteroidales bacterium]
MKKLVVLTGAGMSAESGLKTFRDSGGLWEQYNVYEVATPEAWERDPVLVLRFYNERRKQLLDAVPNEGHLGLVELEKRFDVHIITQNVDDLHERAGSRKVLHLHGEIRKSRSTRNPSRVYDIEGAELNPGDLCELGSQLRPHVVWFGEPVPAIGEAMAVAGEADIFVVIGTSLNVYPAAGLLQYIKPAIPVYIIDPADIPAPGIENVTVIREPAGRGVKTLMELLSKQA